MNRTLEDAIRLIRQAERMVALSGAGISTEAGIPDFRGPGGLWENPGLFRAMSASGFRRDPAAFYRASLKLFPNILNAQPTSAHRLLARLEAEGKVAGVITQNIDGLHQAAGSQVVFEIHGTFRTGHCVECNQKVDMVSYYHDLEMGAPPPPRCRQCHSPVKPDIVLFEDIPPVDVFDAAVVSVKQCDLLAVLGSSLMVYPAADLPRIAMDCGADLLIVNLEPTGFDNLATAVVRAKLGEFVSACEVALRS